MDSDHTDHVAARTWLGSEIQHGWASCALTQNGFVRIISQPRYPSAVSPTEAIRRLRRATRTEHHTFWNCGLSLLDEQVFDPTRIHGPRNVTDAYLLALAVANGARFVTFGRGVPLEAARGAEPGHLLVL